MVQGADLDNAVDEPAQTGGQRRHPDLPVAGFGDDDHICPYQFLLPGEEGRQGRGTGFLLTLDQDGDAQAIARELVGGPKGGDVKHDPGLVVGGSASAEPPAPLGGGERGGDPVLRGGRPAGRRGGRRATRCAVPARRAAGR
jgi:hypothetical protein